METMKKCTAMEEKLAEMLLDPEAAPAKVKTHVAECESCRKELEELRATMAAMDAWTAPEPSPYFMTRLGARMREEREAPPAVMVAAHPRPLCLWSADACSSAGGDGVDGDAADGRRNVPGHHERGNSRSRQQGRGCRGARSADAGQQCAAAGSAGDDSPKAEHGTEIRSRMIKLKTGMQ